MVRQKCEGSLMPPEIQKSVKAVFDAHPKVIPLLQQAAACPDYDEQLDYTVPANLFLETQLLPTVQRCRGTRGCCQIRADLLASEGNRDEALRTALAIFRLGRHFERNPMVISYLVAIAVRGIVAVGSANMALQAGPVTPELHRALEAELVSQKRTDQSELTWPLNSERVYMLETFPKMAPGRSLWFCRAFFNWWESELLDAWQAMATAVKETHTFRETEHSLNAIEQTLSGYAKLDSPPMKSFYYTHALGLASSRSLRVLNAIQAHVPAGSKEVPKLSELGLPAEATIDPFNGEPLHVRATPARLAGILCRQEPARRWRETG